MKSLLNLPYTNLQRVVDLALIIAVVPVFLLVAIPMKFFILLTFIFVLLKKNSKIFIIMLTIIGFLSLGISFFDAFNYVGLSRLNTFVTLIISLLVVAVSLQRLTEKINFYLLISPVMFLGLSLFFYKDITTLFFTIFELFLFTTLLVWTKTKSTLFTALRQSIILFFVSLPVIVLLFIFFPRISFKHAKFGFKAQEYATTGHDGKMWINSNALLVPSKRVVMEVEFLEDKFPRNDQLYFRGSVLYVNYDSWWGGIAERYKSVITNRSDFVTYNVKMYPNFKQFVYALEFPAVITDRNMFLNEEQVIMHKSKIQNSYRYKLTSSLKNIYLQEIIPIQSRIYKKDRNPKAQEEAKKIMNLGLNEEQRIQALYKFFQDQNLTYSLKPKELDIKNIADSLLFDKKVGYCVHFASSFAIMSRMIDIPSRVITGYKANIKNRVNNYLAVKEEDAHSWVEVYLENRGWVRIEPTSTVRAIDKKTQELMQQNNQENSNSTIDSTKQTNEIGLFFMYVKYKIENWILNYNFITQRGLFRDLINDSIFLFKFVFSILSLFVIGFVIFNYLKNQQCREKEICAMRKLLDKLEKIGFIKQDEETIHKFLKRVQDDTKNVNLTKIDILYHKIRYSYFSKKDIKTLENLIKEFKIEKDR
jgi:transglutaminase-like putative cysteine protease